MAVDPAKVVAESIIDAIESAARLGKKEPSPISKQDISMLEAAREKKKKPLEEKVADFLKHSGVACQQDIDNAVADAIDWNKNI